jgi:hypothetical protein
MGISTEGRYGVSTCRATAYHNTQIHKPQAENVNKTYPYFKVVESAVRRSLKVGKGKWENVDR